MKQQLQQQQQQQQKQQQQQQQHKLQITLLNTQHLVHVDSYSKIRVPTFQARDSFVFL